MHTVTFIRAPTEGDTVPISLGFHTYPRVERLLKVRRNLPLAYAIALTLVAVAIAMRWLLSEDVGPRIPFITFYPAIILAALIGGLGPGVVAIVLSTVAAWALFIDSEFSSTPGPQQLLLLGLFLFVSVVNVGIAVVINALVERLLIQSRNIRLLLDSAPSGFLLVDDKGIIRLANVSTCRLFGYTPEELAGKELELLVPGERAQAHRGQRQHYVQEPNVRPMGAELDISGRRKDGTAIPLEIALNPIDGVAVLATVVDVSERKRADEAQRLVIKELMHRTRNLFFVFQALIAISARGVASAQELTDVLAARLQALAKTYELAPGDRDGIHFGELASKQLAVHSGRILLETDDLYVNPQAAQNFALILHELVTNAMKYGALSVPDGRVVVIGRVDSVAQQLVFSWRERGGPPVAIPITRGFGSVILRQMAGQFARRVIMDFLPEGLSYCLYVDLAEIEATAKEMWPKGASQSN